MEDEQDVLLKCYRFTGIKRDLEKAVQGLTCLNDVPFKFQWFDN